MSLASWIETRREPARAGSIEAPQTSGKRVPALDGLRAIAVLLVVTMHYLVIPPGPEGSAAHALIQRIFSLSFCGVDLFFVLSGYFIGGILLDHRGSSRLMPAFYLRRFFRIIPLYLILLASFFVAREVSGLSDVNHGTYFSSSVPDWSYFVFGQNIAMSALRDIGPYWLGVTWSLAVEEQFYLLLPLLVLRMNPRQLVRLCGFLIVLSPALRAVALYSAQNSAAVVFLLPTRMDGLLWGVICAVLVRHPGALTWLRDRRRMLAGLIVSLGAGLVAFSCGKFASDSPELALLGYSALSVFFTAVLLYVVAFPTGHFAATLSIRPLAKIGLTSYFVYLFHMPIWYSLHWLFFRLPPLHFSWSAAGITLVSLVVTLGLALISWRWLEGPLLRFSRRFAYC